MRTAHREVLERGDLHDGARMRFQQAAAVEDGIVAHH